MRPRSATPVGELGDATALVQLCVALPNPVVVFDIVDPFDPSATLVRFLNPAARRAWSEDELVGRSFAEGLPEILQRLQDEVFDLVGTDLTVNLGEVVVGRTRGFRGRTYLARLFAFGDTLVGLSAEDVSELRAAREDLEQSATDLKRSNTDLDDFAYIASHDLREPLRGIRSSCGFLLEDHGDSLEEDAIRRVERMGVLCERLDGLLASLLRFSRSGRGELAWTDTDMDGVVADVELRLEALVASRNATVVRATPLPTVVCDRTRVTEVIYNLVLNALKYNDGERPTVEIGATEDHPRAPGQLTFFVRDDGIGIREKHLESVFQIFRRINGRQKYGEGTGSGLTIVRKIVERHGGEIWVESTFGEGATFYFTLPAPDHHRA